MIHGYIHSNKHHQQTPSCCYNNAARKLTLGPDIKSLHTGAVTAHGLNTGLLRLDCVGIRCAKCTVATAIINILHHVAMTTLPQTHHTDLSLTISTGLLTAWRIVQGRLRWGEMHKVFIGNNPYQHSILRCYSNTARNECRTLTVRVPTTPLLAHALNTGAQVRGATCLVSTSIVNSQAMWCHVAVTASIEWLTARRFTQVRLCRGLMHRSRSQ